MTQEPVDAGGRAPTNAGIGPGGSREALVWMGGEGGLDQSGKKNHIIETFKADPNSSSFKRPDGEMNIASGCPRFVAHSTLESAKNTYIKDDTLFLKVAVDLTDLEDL